MILATFTGIIIRTYEGVLQSAIVLISFIPMLMSTGGNAGSQSSMLITRGIALEEIELSDIGMIFWKELRVSVIIGVVLSVVNFLIIYYLSDINFAVSFAISLSLFITIIIAKVVGSTLPIIAKGLKLDPAIIASPFITTIIDACALIVFFLVCTHYLHLA